MISFKRYIREWVYMDPGSKRIMVVQNKEGKPAEYKSEEEAVFDFAAEANILKNVSDNTYNNLVSILDETAAIDIVGICGYYSLISMTLNVFKVPSDTDKWPLPEIKDFSKMLKS